MLLELSIRDFAIIEGLTISFGRGLNIFTGETGAGKSIIMDAVALILGDRASNEVIRTSKEEAVVEAMFDVSDSKGLDAVLREAGIDHGNELVVKRVVQRAGRNKIYINGSLATLVTLTEVGRRLIDIYGQSEHQSLTRPEEHLELLDSFGGYAELRQSMADAYRAFSTASRALDALVSGARNAAAERELLAFQLKELVDAGLKSGDEEELKREADRLKHAGKLKGSAAGAERALYSDSGSATERLGGAVRELKDAAVIDERLKAPLEALEASLFQIEDAASFLRGYAESIEADPEALDSVEARLDLIGRLKKKHNLAFDGLIAKKDALEKGLNGLGDIEGRIKALEEKLREARDTANQAAAKLTAARAGAVIELKKRVASELADLGMKEARFEIKIETEKNPDGGPRLGEKGSDRVAFLLSANRGEEVRPLARIASGGELSRIMLAMKSVMAAGRVPTLIFDEIDTGVGGAMAQEVGKKLKEASFSHQVICITHLPQIAAFADSHFAVEKRVTPEGRTTTGVKELDGKARVEHISEMLGGANVTDTTRKHAAELMDAALEASKTRARTSRKAKG